MGAVPIFQDLFLVWCVGLLGGLAAYALKQPLLLGYMVGGILISPFTPGPAIQDVETVQHLADFGIVLLMFSIGLELAPHGLRRIGRNSLLIGLLMPLSIVGAWVLIATTWLAWPLTSSIIAGCALSISSTMVITKMLMERGELKSDYGQLLLGIAIIEDCLIMGLLLFFPIMADPSQQQLSSIIWVLVKTVGLLTAIAVLGVRIVPRLMDAVGRTHDPELLVLVLLVLAMGIGVLGVWSGLSLELGAFVAGLILSGSETTSQTMGRMLPIRDLFVVTFFVALGILLDPAVIVRQWPLLLGWMAFVLLFKFAVTTLLCRVLTRQWALAWRVGVGVSQIGEFSIVLCAVARGLKLIPDDVYHLVIAVSLVSIVANTFIFNLLQQAPAVLSSLRHHKEQQVSIISRR